MSLSLHNNAPKIPVEIPDKGTLFIHNHDVMGYISWGMLILGVLFMINGAWMWMVMSIFGLVLARLIKFLVCGWIHSFVAYCQAVEDPKLVVTTKP